MIFFFTFVFQVEKKRQQTLLKVPELYYSLHTVLKLTEKQTHKRINQDNQKQCRTLTLAEFYSSVTVVSMKPHKIRNLTRTSASQFTVKGFRFTYRLSTFKLGKGHFRCEESPNWRRDISDVKWLCLHRSDTSITSPSSYHFEYVKS